MNYLQEAMGILGMYYTPASVLRLGYGDGKTAAIVGNGDGKTAPIIGNPSFAHMSEIGYNTGVNHIKSSAALERHATPTVPVIEAQIPCQIIPRAHSNPNFPLTKFPTATAIAAVVNSRRFRHVPILDRVISKASRGTTFPGISYANHCRRQISQKFVVVVMKPSHYQTFTNTSLVLPLGDTTPIVATVQDNGVESGTKRIKSEMPSEPASIDSEIERNIVHMTKRVNLDGTRKIASGARTILNIFRKAAKRTGKLTGQSMRRYWRASRNTGLLIMIKWLRFNKQVVCDTLNVIGRVRPLTMRLKTAFFHLHGRWSVNNAKRHKPLIGIMMPAMNLNTGFMLRRSVPSVTAKSIAKMNEPI